MQTVLKMRTGKADKLIDAVGNWCVKFINSPRPDFKKISDAEAWIYICKYIFVCGYFKSYNIFTRFVSWITQYYPFSLLFTDRLFHHRNLVVSNFMTKMEEIAGKIGVKVFIPTGFHDELITHFYGRLYCHRKSREDKIKIMEAALQKEYETIYVRDKKSFIEISIPTETLVSVTGYK